MAHRETFYSKCPTRDCGAVFSHDVHLFDLPLQLRACNRCYALLDPATVADWRTAGPAEAIERRS
jgi:hypothetical protein